MSRVKVVLNEAGVREMLRSQEMLDICKGYADAALGRLGAGYSVSTHVGRNRVNAEVKADWNQTRADNLKNDTILKSLKG